MFKSALLSAGVLLSAGTADAQDATPAVPDAEEKADMWSSIIAGSANFRPVEEGLKITP